MVVSLAQHRWLGALLLSLVAAISISAQLKRPTRARVETIKLESKLIGTTLPYRAILPIDYDVATTTRFPVMYLLHGLGGHYTDWTTRTNIADYAAQYRLIIITPEGNDSWYVDSAAVPSDKYESYFVKELMTDVDNRYRTIQSRYGRAIAGLSMGGYGAVKYGLKYPSQFAFVASISGAFNVTRVSEKDTGTDWPDYLKLFGPVDSPTWKSSDVFTLVNDLPPARIASLPYFYFDCGTEDSPRLFNSNRKLLELLQQKKIAHEFRELPGDHSWAYWDQQIQQVLEIAAQKLHLSHSRKQ